MIPLVGLPANWLPGMFGRFYFAGQGYPNVEEVKGTCWKCTRYDVLSKHAELCPDCLEWLRFVSPL